MKRGIVYKSLVSPGSIRAEKGPLVLEWVLGSAGLAEHLSSRSCSVGFLLLWGEWAGFVSEPFIGVMLP